MDWTRAESMDPHLLVGVVNTTLRNEGISLDELCRMHDLDRDGLVARLAEGDYAYRDEINQFR